MSKPVTHVSAPAEQSVHSKGIACRIKPPVKGFIEEEEYCVDADDLADLDDLPWHHIQLAKLYGRKVADEIIRPQMQRRRFGKLATRMKSMEGRSGADHLWSTLRKESSKKLLEEDKRIPQSLKNAYAAFVRQLVLQRGEVPVRRNYCEKEDVPDTAHLLDRSELLKVHELHHKIELMSRSSKLNHNKAEILLFNNPLPDLVNASGNEGIDRYLPSWWLKEHTYSAVNTPLVSRSHKHQLAADPSDTREPTIRSAYNKNVSLVTRPILGDGSRHAGPPKVTFLTEQQAGAERGRFSEAFKARTDPTKTLQDQNVSNLTEDQSTTNIVDIKLNPFKGDAILAAAERKRKEHPSNISTWEPLTLNALFEYSNKKDSIGYGDFRFGKTRMHRVHSAADETADPVS